MEASTDPRALLSGYGQLAGEILERLGPVMSVVLAGAAAGDPDLRRHLATTDAERLTGAQGWPPSATSILPVSHSGTELALRRGRVVGANPPPKRTSPAMAPAASPCQPE